MANKLKEFITSKKLKLTEDHVLVLRKTAENGVTKKGFVYPSKGQVEAPDWDGGIKKCGGGLHGLAWAEGELDIDNYGVFFQVILVDKKDGFINLDGNKCKYRKGEVVLTTRDRYLAISFIKKYDNIHARKINYDHSYELVANQGYDSTANQEGGSIANQGYGSTANQEAAARPTKGMAAQPTKKAAARPTKGKKAPPTKGSAAQPTKGTGAYLLQDYSLTQLMSTE